jgi:hypothetical protein
MHSLPLILFLAVGSTATLARDITTTTGVTYKQIAVTRVEKTGIAVSHRDGAAFLDFSILSESIRREFGYTETEYSAAQALAKEQENVSLERQRRIAAEQTAKVADEERRKAEAQLKVAQFAAKLAEQRAQAEKAQAESSIATRDYTSNDYTTRDYGGSRYTGSGYSGGTVQVSGYYRKDGTYVRPHTRRR